MVSLKFIVVDHHDLLEESIGPLCWHGESRGSQPNLVPFFSFRGNGISIPVFLSLIREPVFDLLVSPMDNYSDQNHPRFAGIHGDFVINHAKDG